MTPAVVALLIVFSRNHNKIASRLLAFDEQNKYLKEFPAPPPPPVPAPVPTPPPQAGSSTDPAPRPRPVWPIAVDPPTAADGYQFRTRTGKAIAGWYRARHPLPVTAAACAIAEAEAKADLAVEQPATDHATDVDDDETIREPTQQELQDEDIFQLARNINGKIEFLISFCRE